MKLTKLVRTTRARIIYLRNDYKDLLKVIDKFLESHFAGLADQEESASTALVDAPIRTAIPEALDQPFAKVNSVVGNSPAATAGLQPGDLIRNFGYVNFANHDGLKKVAECVQGNEGVSNQLDSHLPSRRLANSDFSSKMYLSRSLARGGTPNHRNCA